MVICTTQTAIVQNTFKKFDPGKDIRGTVRAQFSVRSNIECSIRYVFQVAQGKRNVDTKKVPHKKQTKFLIHKIL